MQQTGSHGWLRRPSPSMVVALVALFFAMSGTAVAATHLVSGDSLIKKSTLSGNRLRKHTVTGTQINLSKLGKVPSAVHADNATSANTAAPSGAAGGDLTGSYPDPKVADGAIGTTKFGAIPAARASNSTGESIPSGALTPLTYDTVSFNVGALYSTSSTDRLTAPVAGKYLMIATARWDNNTAGRRLLFFQLNGSNANQLARDSVSPNNSSTFGPEQNVETVYQLAAGDYVQVIAYQDSGSTLSVEYDGLAGPTFSMIWLAP